MGDLEFKIRDLIRCENVQVFSSNYALYGDLSRRVADTLGSLVPTIETYSIDESFLNLGEFNSREVEPLARELRDRVYRWVGIPTSVGIAPTKTLAKWQTLSRRNGRSIAASVICVPAKCGRSFCLPCR